MKSRFIKQSLKTTPLILSTILLTACGSDSSSGSNQSSPAAKADTSTPDTTTPDTTTPDTTQPTGTIKNVIMMIGDGMGPQQVGLLEDYVKRAPSNPYNGKNSAISSFATQGNMALSMNGPHGSLVVDSACSASQLATGVASGSEMLGLDKDGNKVETILEKAKAMGKATGLVSDTRLTHATPAAFASHQRHRSLENDIAEEMLKDVQVDVMLSGGLRHWIPQGSDETSTELVNLINEPTVQIKSKRSDDTNLLVDAQNLGYSLAFNKTQLANADDDKLLGLFAYSGLDNGITYSQNKGTDAQVQPSLKEMTQKALDVLSKDDDGFFLMIEGGQIDWAGHNNDTATMLHELLKFDEAVQAVYDWVKDRNDTLVLITADHETGSFGFSYSRTNLPTAQQLSGEAFQGHDYHPNFNFGSLENLDKIHGQTQSFSDFYYSEMADKDLTATELMNKFNAISEFHITVEQAAQVLEMETNVSKTEADEKYGHHTYLSDADFPKVDDFEEFYVYGEEIQMDLLGRKVAAGQNTVWGTGTHTSVPVPVIAWGPAEAIAPYKGLMHHVNVGEITINTLIGSSGM
jgi:alkaline phosphatase